MTGQEDGKQKPLLVAMTMNAILIATMSLLTSEEDVNAQMKMTNRSGFENTNTSLSQAIVIAEKSVGNNSFAIAGFGTNVGGNLGYTIIISTHGPEFYNVTVNSNNGQILTTEQITQGQLEKAHLEHSQKVLSEPHLMNNTFVH